jgi:hypothetical protein
MCRADGLAESAMPPMADVLLHGGETTLGANNCLTHCKKVDQIQWGKTAKRRHRGATQLGGAFILWVLGHTPQKPSKTLLSCQSAFKFDP